MRMGLEHKRESCASECELCSVRAPEDSESVWEKHRVLVIAASTVLFGVAFAVEYLTKNVRYGHATFLVVILLSGRGIIGAAFRSIMRRRLDVNFLMTVAAFGAFAKRFSTSRPDESMFLLRDFSHKPAVFLGVPVGSASESSRPPPAPRELNLRCGSHKQLEDL